jgi:hypothetical protein
MGPDIDHARIPGEVSNSLSDAPILQKSINVLHPLSPSLLFSCVHLPSVVMATVVSRLGVIPFHRV